MNDGILWKVVELGKEIESLTNENDYWKRKCNEMGIALNTYEKGKYQEHLENEKLKSIIDKAIEYIEEQNKLFRDNRSIGEWAVFLKFANKLLEILRGDKE